MTYKEFVQNHVPFSQLKKVGFFSKETKFNDYETITERFLKFFGVKSMQEYIGGLPTMVTQSEGKFPDKVNERGELKMGGGFHLSLAEREYEIECCICGKNQIVSISTSTNQSDSKCKGCKRKIHISIDKADITVTER